MLNEQQTTKHKQIKIAIFASGSGTNAEQIILYFKDSKSIAVSLILSNKPDAYVLQRAKDHNIPSFVFSVKELNGTELIVNKLKEFTIDFIVLAGFMIKVPANILSLYPNRIVNIHPALLPKHGGKGMYGMYVHSAVIDSKETESGISIHYVNEKYDDGQIIFQAKCPVIPGDTPELLANKIHKLEHEHYPKIIEQVINNTFKI